VDGDFLLPNEIDSLNFQHMLPMKLGQKFVKDLVDFLADMKTPKINSEIN
jgi:hypothetical protein